MRVFFPKFDQAELVRRLTERLEVLKGVLLLRRVVLFGSWARGNFTVASDIDLLVVYRGAPREDAFAVVKKTMNIPALEPHVYSEEEYRQLEGQIARMTEGGVVLFSS
ncbi:MAG: nucleotidyltransferase domain-containing protein [Anaerolineae bacterium]